MNKMFLRIFSLIITITLTYTSVANAKLIDGIAPKAGIATTLVAGATLAYIEANYPEKVRKQLSQEKKDRIEIARATAIALFAAGAGTTAIGMGMNYRKNGAAGSSSTPAKGSPTAAPATSESRPGYLTHAQGTTLLDKLNQPYEYTDKSGFHQTRSADANKQKVEAALRKFQARVKQQKAINAEREQVKASVASEVAEALEEKRTRASKLTDSQEREKALAELATPEARREKARKEVTAFLQPDKIEIVYNYGQPDEYVVTSKTAEDLQQRFKDAKMRAMLSEEIKKARESATAKEQAHIDDWVEKLKERRILSRAERKLRAEYYSQEDPNKRNADVEKKANNLHEKVYNLDQTLTHGHPGAVILCNKNVHLPGWSNGSWKDWKSGMHVPFSSGSSPERRTLAHKQAQRATKDPEFAQLREKLIAEQKQKDAAYFKRTQAQQRGQSS